MDKLIKGSGKFWICLAIGLLWAGLFEAHGGAESNGTQPAASALNETNATANATETDPGAESDLVRGVLGVIKKVLTYPLIKMGESNLTLQSLIILGILFVLVIVIEKIVRERVIMRIFEKTDFPESLEYGLARIMGYVFIVIGWYMALQFVGIDLSSLAIIAGGISVGVGFGLQNIINNFVSGIIIFAERPIAIGDRVEVSGIAGRVVKISLRSTTVITNDNITMIVPNADFISQTVTNWSHGDPKVRIRVPIGVAYGTDIELLKKVLLEIAEDNPKALKDPKPSVLFSDFGDNSLNFELALWTASMTTRPRRFISTINFAIEKKLRENNIEIPFPQLDLHVRADTLEIKNPEGTKPSSE